MTPQISIWGPQGGITTIFVDTLHPFTSSETGSGGGDGRGGKTEERRRAKIIPLLEYGSRWPLPVVVKKRVRHKKKIIFLNFF